MKRLLLLPLLALLALPALAAPPVTLVDKTGMISNEMNAFGAQAVYQGNSTKATYVVNFNASPTTEMDLVSIQPAAGYYMYLRRLVITNVGSQTTAGLVTVQLRTVSGMGSGGSAASVLRLDRSVDVFGALASYRNYDTTPATLSENQQQIEVYVPSAAAAMVPISIDFCLIGQKCPRYNNVFQMALTHPGAAGAAGFSGFIEFTVELK